MDISILVGVALFLFVALVLMMVYNIKMAEALERTHYYLCRLRGVDENGTSWKDNIHWLERQWREHLAPIFEEMGDKLKAVLNDDDE